MNKTNIFMLIGFVSSWIIEQMGGWTIPLQVFFWCIVMDSISGYIVGGIFHTSPNTPNGRLYSRFMFKGIVKKFMYICMIILATQIDLLLSVSYIGNGLIIGFIILDLTSIIENVGLMGITLPKVLADSLELLNREKMKGTKL